MTNWDTMLCSRTDGWKPWLSPNLDIWICYLIFAEFVQFFFGSNQMNVDISCMQTQNRFFSCKTVPTNPARTNKVASKPFRFRIVAETARVVWYAFPVELFVEHRKIYPCWLSLTVLVILQVHGWQRQRARCRSSTYLVIMSHCEFVFGQRGVTWLQDSSTCDLLWQHKHHFQNRINASIVPLFKSQQFCVFVNPRLQVNVEKWNGSLAASRLGNNVHVIHVMYGRFTSVRVYKIRRHGTPVMTWVKPVKPVTPVKVKFSHLNLKTRDLNKGNSKVSEEPEKARLNSAEKRQSLMRHVMTQNDAKSGKGW